VYKIKKLENGLTIVGEEIPYLRSVSLGMWVNAGSRMEDEKNSGTSHFIEHMLFKGTKNRSAKDIVSEIDNIGGQLNAFTTKECTCYYIKLLDEHIGIGIDVLSDMILNSNFDEGEIKKEKSIILEELKMYEDSPDDLSYDFLLENIYKDNALGMNILGTEKSLDEMSRESILDYFEKLYVPNNAVVSISGNFNFDKLVRDLSLKFGEWKSGETNIVLEEAEFSPCFITKNKDTEQVSLAICMKGIALEDDQDTYALSVVNNIFGASGSSRLFQKIREDKGLVYSIYSEETLYRKCGEFGIFSSMSTENVEEVYNLIMQEIEYLKKNYITEEELKFSKEQLKGSYILDLESTGNRMGMIGKSMLLSQNIKTTDEILESIEMIDMKSVKDVVDKVFGTAEIGVCIVGRDVEDIRSL
jgi:predicted Zn-dependent peptidase